jgi:hypothetical protein
MKTILLLLVSSSPCPDVTNGALGLDEAQRCVASKIITTAKLAQVDPIGLLSIAWHESRLDPTAIGRARDFGLMQINCSMWYEYLGFETRTHCTKELLDIDANLHAAVIIIEFLQGFKQCRGSGLWRCYNGGPGWAKSQNVEQIHSYHRRIQNTYIMLQQRSSLAQVDMQQLN